MGMAAAPRTAPAMRPALPVDVRPVPTVEPLAPRWVPTAFPPVNVVPPPLTTPLLPPATATVPPIPEPPLGTPTTLEPTPVARDEDVPVTKVPAGSGPGIPVVERSLPVALIPPIEPPDIAGTVTGVSAVARPGPTLPLEEVTSEGVPSAPVAAKPGVAPMTLVIGAAGILGPETTGASPPAPLTPAPWELIPVTVVPGCTGLTVCVLVVGIPLLTIPPPVTTCGGVSAEPIETTFGPPMTDGVVPPAISPPPTPEVPCGATVPTAPPTVPPEINGTPPVPPDPGANAPAPVEIVPTVPPTPPPEIDGTPTVPTDPGICPPAPVAVVPTVPPTPPPEIDGKPTMPVDSVVSPPAAVDDVPTAPPTTPPGSTAVPPELIPPPMFPGPPGVSGAARPKYR
ncbi:uncharacterized protein [Dermacentor andersoni]|uniref:uncharacterized protein n=1 Tax=Dermacentor andersoni TaxID=34620 RepID=UPI003B3B855B